MGVNATGTPGAAVNGFTRRTVGLAAEEVSAGWQVKKRDGRVAPFDCDKVRKAVSRCFASVRLSATLEGGQDAMLATLERVTRAVVNSLAAGHVSCPDVEHVQRLVIQQLWSEGLFDAAEHYQNYREGRRKVREERRVDPEQELLIAADAKHFPAPLQYFQFLDKYARWDEEKLRRETWRECCDRVMQFFRTRPQLAVVPEEVWGRLDRAFYNHHASPAMRIVQMAGPALERCNVGAFNCCYTPVDSLDAFVETLYLLMNGCGVGFSVESCYVEQIPRVRRQRGLPAEVYVIGDTTEQWCDAYRHGLEAWVDGRDVEFDYSKIRPRGARLKTKGGRASGPGPLRDLLTFARHLILSRQGRCLTSKDCHEIMCMTGRVGQLGGVRRASEISISDLDDLEMRDAKHGNWYGLTPWLEMANNSAAYDQKPSAVEFMREWLALAESGSGERGIFNRGGACHQIPKRRKPARFGLNPCLAGDTLVVTDRGAFPIKALVGKTARVHDGHEWREIDTFRVTGHDQPMLRVTLRDGAEVRLTPYHTMVLEDGSKVEAHELVVGDRLRLADVTYDGPLKTDGAYLKGFLAGDGTLIKERQAHLWLYEPKFVCKDRILASLAEIPIDKVRTNAKPEAEWRPGGKDDRLVLGGLACRAGLREWCDEYRRRLPPEVFAWDRKTKQEFLAGLFDADGAALDTQNGFSYQLSSVRPEFLRDVQTLLKSLGVRSKLGLMKAASRKEMPGGVYDCQASYRLSVGQQAAIRLAKEVSFTRLQSFHDRETAYNVKSRAGIVVSVEPDGVDPTVYCCTVPATHQVTLGIGVVTGQCGEVYLRPRQMCNLSIAVARDRDTFESLADKVEVAAIFGTLQATLTNFRYLRDEWKANCDEERLLGVDINGQMDCPILRPGAPGREAMLDELRERVLKVNREWSGRLGIPASAAATVVKPSGNSAAFFGCSSGMHARWSRYQVRRVRLDSVNPLAALLKAEGVPYEVDPRNETILVFDFLPDPAPEGTPTRNDMTAVEQFHNWLAWKRHWTEHNPSCTIYVGPDEWLELGAEVYEHFDQVGGLSFLPRDSGTYRLAPNEELTEAEYEKRRAAFPDIQWAKLLRYETFDQTTSSSELACTGQGCEV